MATSHILTEAGDFIDTEGSDRLVTEASTPDPFTTTQSAQLRKDNPFALQVIAQGAVGRNATW